MADILVDRADSFDEGDRRLVTNGTLEIGVFKVRDKFFAFANSCPHQGGPVCQGKIMPKVVETLDAGQNSLGLTFSETTFHLVCPWHGFEFSFETGAHPGASRYRLRRFDTKVVEGQVYVVV